MVINEEQAETVRRIYRECLEGYGTALIAKGLTADGIKTGKGNIVWVGNGVHRILRNEKYCGDILMQKRVTLDFLTHKRAPNRGRQPQYFIADHHPAIVSKEDWNAVQTELNRRAKMNNSSKTDQPQKHSNRTVFSNILFCGTCGEPFIRRTLKSTKKNNKYLYPVWKCRVADGRRRGMECHARSYREEAMEHCFMAMLQGMKHEQEELMQEAQMVIAQDELDDWEKERMDYLETEIESLEEIRSHAAASAQKSPARDVYDELSIDLTQEIEVLLNEKEKLNKKKQEALMKKRILNWLIEALDNLNGFDPISERTDFREDIFRRIVERGDVFDDGTIIYELVFGVTRKALGNGRAIWKISAKGESSNKSS
jgi:hypothetical protein